MKKVLVILLFAALCLSAAPVLIEAYQEGTITLPEDKIDTVTVVELSFSVDTSCCVQFTAGGLTKFLTKMLLELDGNYLFPAAAVQGNVALSALIVYTYLITPGDHIVRLRITKVIPTVYTHCESAYLQALIFLPDTPSAVAEPPGEPSGLSPLPALISRGPYVNVAGATELVDATGRVIEGAIEDDKVFIANLPQGTYFARSEERTVVKVVVVR